MMYSATLLASLLASAHGFAATPKGGVECSANEEKFFVYSIDPSMLYPFVASANGPSAPPSVTKGLVGNTWQGLLLSITQGDTTITQAGGKPLTVTSPNSGGFNVVSEDFCLGDGNWTVRQGAFAWDSSTHPELGAYDATAASYYLTLEERSAPGAPINTVPVKPQAIVDWALETLNVDVNNFENSAECKSDPSVQGNCFILSPFMIRWAIFPAEMRADAEAAAATGPLGMSFILDNQLKAWAIGEVDYEKEKVIPFVPNGEQACEGRGYGKASCEAVGCCQYAECSIGDGSGECHSAVGRRQCTDVDFVSHVDDCSNDDDYDYYYDYDYDACTDIDDRRMNGATGGDITSCAAGFATYNNVCSEDMFTSIGAPVGWFMTRCRVTCGDCS